jgi:RimJ/RimL family protein N-acetyltransferase
MSLYTVEWFRRSLEDHTFSGMIGCGVFLRRDDSGPATELVGGIGFHSIVPRHHQCEIGYWLDAGHRGRGYCTEATRWLLSLLLTPQDRSVTGADGSPSGGWGFRRVEIFGNAANAPSAAVPRRLGLPLECVRRMDRWWPGVGWVDSLGWAVLDDEWDRAGHAMKPGVNRGVTPPAAS